MGASEPRHQQLHRLTCGVIYTDAFAAYLRAWWMQHSSAHPNQVPSLDYVRCKEGEKAGQAWISLLWQGPAHLEPHGLFLISPVQIYLAKPTRLALKDRCLDVEGDNVIVR